MIIFYVYTSSGYYMEVGTAIHPNNKMRSLSENYEKGYGLDISTRKVVMQWGMSPKEIENVNNGVLLTPHQKGVNAKW